MAMPNYVPYAALVLISLSLFLLLLRRARPYDVFVIVFAFSGFIYVFEFVILVLLDSYEYIPGIFSIRYQDNVLGALISNLLLIPVLSACIIVFNLRWPGVVLITALLAGVEALFIYLGIYRLHWWRIQYSAAFIPLYFLMCPKWIDALRRGHRISRFMLLFMFAWSLVGTLVYLMSLFGFRLFHSGLFQDVYRDDIFMSALYALYKGFIFSVFISVFCTRRLQLCSLLLIFATNLLLLRLGVIRVFVPLWCYYGLYVFCCTLIFFLNRLAYRALGRIAESGLYKEAQKPLR